MIASPLATQVRRMIDAGVDGLFALGSSAEVAFLTRENRRAVIETIVKAADGKVPVLVGVIDTTTLRVAEHVADAVPRPPCGAVAAPGTSRSSGTSCPTPTPTPSATPTGFRFSRLDASTW